MVLEKTNISSGSRYNNRDTLSSAIALTMCNAPVHYNFDVSDVAGVGGCCINSTFSFIIFFLVLSPSQLKCGEGKADYIGHCFWEAAFAYALAWNQPSGNKKNRLTIWSPGKSAIANWPFLFFFYQLLVESLSLRWGLNKAPTECFFVFFFFLKNCYFFIFIFFALGTSLSFWVFSAQLIKEGCEHFTFLHRDHVTLYNCKDLYTMLTMPKQWTD